MNEARKGVQATPFEISIASPSYALPASSSSASSCKETGKKEHSNKGDEASDSEGKENLLRKTSRNCKFVKIEATRIESQKVTPQSLAIDFQTLL